jgi:hypothetical protein
MHAISDTYTPDIVRIVTRAVKRARFRLSVDTIEAAIKGTRPLFSDDDFRLDLLAAERTLQSATLDGGDTAAAQLQDQLQKRYVQKLELGTLDDIAFQDGLAEAQLFLRQNGARFVTNITASTRKAIAEVIEQGFKNGVPPREMARQLKRLNLIGLTAPHALAVQRFKQNILDNTLRGRIAAERESAAYADKLLRLRMTTIARHETLLAANRGQELLWQQQQQAGLVSERSRRRWIITPDGRICPLCFPMAGKLAKIGGPWQTARGPVMTPQDLHVQCRCSQGLVMSPSQGELNQPLAQPKPKLPTLVEPPSSTLPSGLVRPRPRPTRVRPRPRPTRASFSMDEVKSLEKVMAKGLDVDQVRDATRVVRERVKERIARTLGKRTEGIYTKFNGDSWYADVMGGTPTTPLTTSQLSEAISDRLIRQWSYTSGDAMPLSVEIQNAINVEFGLGKTASTAHLKSVGLQWANAQKLEDFRKFLRGWVRQQYEVTQAWLKRNGIRDVSVFRGHTIPEADATKLIKGGSNDGVSVSQKLQPASSYSTDGPMASSFSEVAGGEVSGMTSVRVPASQIFSTCRTGFGCLIESEVVILGEQTPGFLVTNHDSFSKFLADLIDSGFLVKRQLEMFVDAFIENADWTKVDWDALGITTTDALRREILASGQTVAAFKKLPTYLLHKDRKVLSDL